MTLHYASIPFPYRYSCNIYPLLWAKNIKVDFLTDRNISAFSISQSELPQPPTRINAHLSKMPCFWLRNTINLPIAGSDLNRTVSICFPIFYLGNTIRIHLDHRHRDRHTLFSKYSCHPILTTN
uniref:Uncharacterized protein n=1 Tax=Candidatus Kentrum sp. LPFa TaxID=2126335 RepID=A0A450WAB6_9GAMM|nr:MAG: hypothetical protein BECKLPF1236B_GA0070989_105424 [Candidatus Kentron sp. LPFa]